MDQCYCQLDECLDAIFAIQPDSCPDCAVGEPTTTTITTTDDGSGLST